MTTQIIYTRNMEPITAIEMPLSVLLPPKGTDIGLTAANGEPVPLQPILRCDLYAISIRPLIVVTDDEEQALALESAWLPGQMRAVYAAYDEGHNTGAAKALRMLLR